MRRWLQRPFLCKFGLHVFDSMERSWPVPNPEHRRYYHCARCQKVIHSCYQ